MDPGALRWPDDAEMGGPRLSSTHPPHIGTVGLHLLGTCDAELDSGRLADLMMSPEQLGEAGKPSRVWQAVAHEKVVDRDRLLLVHSRYSKRGKSRTMARSRAPCEQLPSACAFGALASWGILRIDPAPDRHTQPESARASSTRLRSRRDRGCAARVGADLPDTRSGFIRANVPAADFIIRRLFAALAA